MKRVSYVVALFFTLLFVVTLATPATIIIAQDGTPSPLQGFDGGGIEGIEPINVLAAVDFESTTDSFSFPNYGNETGFANLSATEMIRLFGAGVCRGGQTEPCKLNPVAQQWMDAANNAMGGGHCDGMAVLSILFEYGVISPNDFGGDSTAALDIMGNDALQREIAYWWATQIASPQVQALFTTNPLTPTQVLEALQESYSQGYEGPTYTIGFFQPDGSGGHAVTPWGIDDRGDGIYWILIYDNNFPGITRAIQVDTNNDTWAYIASTNPDEPEAVYMGDASTKTLILVPSQARLDEHPCPFCEKVKAKPKTPTPGPEATTAPEPTEEPGSEDYDGYQLWMEGKGRLIITDAEGRSAGIIDNKVVNDIPGVQILRFTGQDLWNVDAPYSFLIPAGIAFTATVDGSEVTENTSNTITMIGGGYYLSIDEVVLEPGTQDAFYFTEDGLALSYAAEEGEAPIFVVAWNGEDADYAVGIAGVDLPSGEVHIAFGIEEGVIVLAGGDSDSSFVTSLTRFNEETDEIYLTSEPFVLGGADVAYVDFVTGADRGEFAVLIDRGNTGDPQESILMELDKGDE